MSALCSCGEPLHYTDPTIQSQVQEMVDRLGATTRVTTPGGSWQVPRHYIALHGLIAAAIPELAESCGWERAQ